MTFSESVLFTLQAEVQAGLASHLPVPLVPSLRGWPKPSVNRSWSWLWLLEGYPIQLVGTLEAR